MLRTIILTMALSAFAPTANAEDGEGMDLMEEALRLFMRGLMQEVEPRLDDLSSLLENLDAYHPPEVLPNGDIIIRRKQPELDGDTLAPDGGEIDL